MGGILKRGSITLLSILLLSMISEIFVWRKKLTFSQIKKNKEFLKGFIEMNKFISLLRINILLIAVEQFYFIRETFNSGNKKILLDKVQML